MGIDGIGKKGPPAPPPPARGTGGPARTDEPTRPFDPTKTAPATPAVEAAAPRTALERVRAGELDVEGYVDAKVLEATAHLKALPPAQLEQVRASLRARMASDPALVDLVRTATGATPSPRDDG
jgi:hypothetical protein